MAECPFCQRIRSGEVFSQSGASVAVLDRYPVNEGHALLIPRRHVADFFELNQTEQNDLLCLLNDVRRMLVDLHHPAGFNVGINVGAASGQTIQHAHVHLIPRYEGDVADPRGGVRAVIPHRARYWEF